MIGSILDGGCGIGWIVAAAAGRNGSMSSSNELPNTNVNLLRPARIHGELLLDGE